MIGPTIGLFTITLDIDGETKIGTSKAYIDWLYACGAFNVIIIPHTCTNRDLNKYMNSIDGLLIPGGNDDIHNNTAIHYRTISAALKIAIRKKMPVMGICAGMMTMASYELRTWPLHVKVYNVLGTPDVQIWKSSKFYKNMKTKNTMYNHHYGIDSKLIENNPSSNMEVLSVSKQGYVATVVWKSYPWIATQWHPEKPEFEMSSFQNIVRTKDARELGRYMGEYFIKMIHNYKKSHNHPISKNIELWHVPKELLTKFDMPSQIYLFK